jgi:hypothetical protein
MMCEFQVMVGQSRGITAANQFIGGGFSVWSEVVADVHSKLNGRGQLVTLVWIREPWKELNGTFCGFRLIQVFTPTFTDEGSAPVTKMVDLGRDQIPPQETAVADAKQCMKIPPIRQ